MQASPSLPVPLTPCRGRVLVVDDEPSVRQLIARGLARAGYAVEVTAGGAEGLRRALTENYDLVVLDLLMPGIDGMAVLRGLSPQKPDLRVLVLSCLTDTRSKVQALRLGADDYLAKPFSFDELLARVDARVRDSFRAAPAHPITVGPLRLDVEHQRAELGAGWVELPKREFFLLHELARHPGHTLSKRHLLSAVWGLSFDPGSNVVDVCVGRLRAKLGAEVVDTVRGEGYRLGVV